MKRNWTSLRLAMGLLLAACADVPLPETQVVVVVDTDLPATLATRLRVDLYAHDGRWFATREIPRPSARDYPTTFGVVSADASDVFLRARIHPEGHVRDYRGERFAPFAAVPEADGLSLRLLVDGRDRTPPSEPNPDVTIDRVVRLSFVTGAKRHVRVLLRGECAGTMARIVGAGERIEIAALASCVDRRGELAPIVAAETTGARAMRSELGAWVAEPCPPEGPPLGPRLCVAGDAFVFGNAADGLRLELPPRERLVRLRRFWVDRREVSVADFRAALARGFVPPSPPREHDGPLVADPVDGCVFTKSVLDREALPMNCISWSTASAYCEFHGGALPTEAQWEYLASAAGRAAKTTFPWGDDEPTCERASFGRAFVDPAPGVCQAQGSGLQPVGVPAEDRNALGAYGLGGGVSEWMRDVLMPLDAPCWAGAPVTDPSCGEGATRRSVRGGAWSAPPPLSRSALRRGAEEDARHASVGVRCVYGAP